MFFWVGRAVPTQLCQAVFGVASYEAMSSGKTSLPPANNAFSERVHNIIAKLRELTPLYQAVFVVKEDGEPSLRAAFLSHLIEDKTETSMSYPQFLVHLRGKLAPPG